MPVTLTWTGHATWLIDTGSGTLLVDPFFDECPTASMKAKDVRCDAILVTHGHFDHVADLVAIAKRTGAKVYCNWEIAQWLAKQGVEQAQPMNLGGQAALPGGTARMEIAHHSSSLPDGTYGGNPAGWVLDVAGVRIYLAGDTGLFSAEPLRHLAADRAGCGRMGAASGRGATRGAARAPTGWLAHRVGEVAGNSTGFAGGTRTSIASPTTRTSKTSTFSFGLSHQAPSQSRNRQACHGQVTTPSRSGPVPSDAPMCGQRSSIAE